MTEVSNEEAEIINMKIDQAYYERDQYKQALIEARDALKAADAVIPYDGKINAMAHSQIEQQITKINKVLGE